MLLRLMQISQNLSMIPSLFCQVFDRNRSELGQATTFYLVYYSCMTKETVNYRPRYAVVKPEMCPLGILGAMNGGFE